MAADRMISGEPDDGVASPIVGPGRSTATGASVFARRVGGVFATRVIQFALALPTSILISRLLGPADKGAFVAVATLPGMLAALGMLGLPSAVNYFAGRGSSVGSLVRASLAFTLVLSVALVGIVWLSLPWLETSFLRAAPDELARVILITLPVNMVASFGGALLYGRQAIRTYNLVLISQSVVTLVAAVLFVGVFRLGVAGAVTGTILSTIFLAVSVALVVRGLERRDRAGEPISLRALVTYGSRLYPASVTGYFNYRADNYLIQALLLTPGRALGLYSIAVTFAELIFYVPDSIATMLLPRVAGSTAEDASAIVARIGRLTMLVTAIAAMASIPAAIIGINIILPAYVDAIPAFLVLLPGVVTLSLAKVMTSYLSGRGRPGTVSVGAIVALVLNVSLNVVLIPTLGIVGASLASLVSYTALAGMMVVAASRLGGRPVLSLFVPGAAEVAVIASAARTLGHGGWRAWSGRRSGGQSGSGER